MSPDPTTTSSGSEPAGGSAGLSPVHREIGDLPKAPAFVALNSVAEDLTDLTAEITIDGRARWGVRFQPGVPIMIPPELFAELGRGDRQRAVEFKVDITTVPANRVRDTIEKAKRQMYDGLRILGGL